MMNTGIHIHTIQQTTNLPNFLRNPPSMVNQNNGVVQLHVCKQFQIRVKYFVASINNLFHVDWLLAFERRKIIVKESLSSDSVKIQGQEQCESQKDVSISEYLLRHCHIVTVSTARLPTVQTVQYISTVYWSEEL